MTNDNENLRGRVVACYDHVLVEPVGEKPYADMVIRSDGQWILATDFAAIVAERDALRMKERESFQKYVDANEALIESRDGWHMANGVAELAMKHRDEAEARAERLAEALRMYMAAGFGNSTDFYKQAEAQRSAHAALHDAAIAAQQAEGEAS